jgi:hypothetical protein
MEIIHRIFFIAASFSPKRLWFFLQDNLHFLQRRGIRKREKRKNRAYLGDVGVAGGAQTGRKTNMNIEH